MTMTDSSAGNVRRTVRFSGRVQGVGFRYTTREIAERFAVVGFVQNLPDGRVLLTAEGVGDELDRFVAAIVAQMDRHIAHLDTADAAATGEFAGFEIRR